MGSRRRAGRKRAADDVRDRYVAALREADEGDIEPLVAFAMSQ